MMGSGVRVPASALALRGAPSLNGHRMVTSSAAASVPLWAAALIGLGGGVLAVLVRIVHDRGAEFRTRQIEAADHYLTTAYRIQASCRQLWVPLYTGQALSADEVDHHFADLEAARDEQMLALNRMMLLFEGRSRIGLPLVAYHDALDGMAGTLAVLYGRGTIEQFSGMTPGHGLYVSAAQKAGPTMVAFTEAVGKEMRQVWIRRKLGEIGQPKPGEEAARWKVLPARVPSDGDQSF